MSIYYDENWNRVTPRKPKAEPEKAKTRKDEVKPGQRFGSWEVMEVTDKVRVYGSGRLYPMRIPIVRCRCLGPNPNAPSCGTEREVLLYGLLQGKTSSCGECVRRDNAKRYPYQMLDGKTAMMTLEALVQLSGFHINYVRKKLLALGPKPTAAQVREACQRVERPTIDGLPLTEWAEKKAAKEGSRAVTVMERVGEWKRQLRDKHGVEVPLHTTEAWLKEQLEKHRRAPASEVVHSAD